MTTNNQARYVVMHGTAPYEMVLGVYASGHRQWNPVGDGYSIDLGIHGFATLAEAIRECDDVYAETVARSGVFGTAVPCVVELPIRVRGTTPAGQVYDSSLTRVHTAAIPVGA